MLQEPLLTPETPGIASELAIRPDHPMTGKENGQRVLPIGHTHGPDGILIAKLTSQMTIGKGMSERDPGQGLPDRLLKRCSFGNPGDRERLALPLEIFIQLLPALQQRCGWIRRIQALFLLECNGMDGGFIAA